MMRLTPLALLVSAAACGLAAGSTSADAASAVVLRGARVIDGTSAAPLESADVFIEGATITHVGPAGQAPAPAGATVVECGGKTIIPGLIAAHAHLGQVDGIENGAGNYNRANILRQLGQYQAYGVTTVVSLGLNGPLFYELRPQLHAGELAGADLLGADRGIGVPNGAPPAAALNIGEDQLDRPATAEEARACVRAAKARGADLIKLWLDDFRGSLPVKMAPEVYEAVIDEAHRNDLRVAAHIYYLADAKALVRAGVDVLAHGVRDQSVDEEFIELVRSRNVGYIPTIGVDESAYIFADRPEWMQDAFFKRAVQPALQLQFDSDEWRKGILANRALDKSRAAVKQNQQNTLKLHQAGALVGLGADSGANPLRIPGFAEHRELQLLVEAGVSPLDAIAIATGNSAQLLRLGDRGRIAPGMQADLVVLNANPLEQIANTQQIHSVWRRGAEVAADGALAPPTR